MAKTNAERKRAQRERKKRLRMQRIELDLAWGERELIARNAQARGFADRTEYLVRLALDDEARIKRDRSRNRKNEQLKAVEKEQERE